MPIIIVPPIVGQICKKPILRSINPPHCPVHAQAAEKHLQRALKRAGLDVPSPGKLAPKLHVVVVEYVRQIQTKRSEAQRKSVSKIKSEEKASES
ncbi:putative sentrin/sumo-specific protease [Hibiscus syriacus]|uniref:Sentrin/sumo-specific protease n=1 Tax=Hibiscus syriacus TaxID=106335 RepID=A0A6A2YZL9_HIBSY|nr:putative sentrin/sumo-specific protease [Hibiscus syriacus]